MTEHADDQDELPSVPTEAEATLARELGPDGLRAVDAVLCRHCGRSWRKVAAVVASALGEVEPQVVGEAHLDLYLRRLIALVDAGVLEARGNLRRLRRSEVRLAP